MNHRSTNAAAWLLSMGMALFGCGATSQLEPAPRTAGASPSSDGGTSSSTPAAERLSELRAARAAIFVKRRGECLRWDFAGDSMSHVFRDEDGARLRSSMNVAQRGELVDVEQGCTAPADPTDEPSMAACGPGVDLTFRVVDANASHITLRVVDSTDFDAAQSPREHCRWYLSLDACERDAPRDDCGL